VNANDVETLFPNILKNIRLISEQILASISKRYDTWEKDSCIGDKFQSFIPFLKQYKDYCRNNERSGKMLVTLINQNKKFKEYLEEEEKL